MQLRVQNVVLPSRLYDQTLSFYRKTLGLPVIYEGPSSCFLRAGGVNIVLHVVDDKTEFPPTGRGIYLDLLVDDLSVPRASFRDAGIPILREWRDHNGHFLLVADPEGNLLEVYQANPE